MDIESVFSKFDKEFLEFDRVENKLSKRADLHAFMLLDSLVPGSGDIVVSSQPDLRVNSLRRSSR